MSGITISTAPKKYWPMLKKADDNNCKNGNNGIIDTPEEAKNAENMVYPMYDNTPDNKERVFRIQLNVLSIGADIEQGCKSD